MSAAEKFLDELVAMVAQRVVQQLRATEPANEPGLLTRSQCARALGISLPTLDRAIAQGCPKVTVGRLPRKAQTMTRDEAIEAVAGDLHTANLDASPHGQPYGFEPERVKDLWRERARVLLCEIGAVFPDPALLAKVREAEARKEHHHFSVRKHEPHDAPIWCTLYDCRCFCADCHPKEARDAALLALGRAVAGGGE